jgi:WD40 repeat protein
LEIAANASLLTSVFAVPHLGRVVAAGAHGDVTVWDSETWEKVDSFQFEDHLLSAVDAEEIKSILSADGQHCTASVWNVETGAKVREFACDDWVLSVAFATAARGVITVDEEHWVTMWEVDSGYSLWRVRLQAVSVLACMSDFGVVICNDADDLVFFDEFGSELIKLPSAVEGWSRVKHAVSALTYDPQSMEVAVGDPSGALTVWSLRDANSLEVLARPPTPRVTSSKD